ncbi:MAG: dockerin type I repeat-containing protein, partial [Oscillospiraceae bacterium]|nr:dockerin type I repeat-containing protein [Candidatus Equicaccousia limihippi]
LTATANEGFTIDAWCVNGAAVSYNATETVTVDANTVYVANFVSDGLFNYIDNGDFESTDDSEHHKQSNVWTTDGNMNKIYTPETPDYDAANVHSGNNSFCLSNLSVQGVGNNWWQIPLKEGQSYVLKFYFKGVQMGMGIGLSDKTDVKLPTAWDGIGSMFNPLVTQIEKLGWGKMGFKDAWQEFSYNIDVPTTKDADDVMYLTILFCTNGHTAYVDDFTLYTAGAAAYVKTDVGVNGAAGHNAGGSASASATSVAPGGQVTLTATANEGFTFDGWYVDGKLVSTANPYVATVTKDTTFLANFKSDEPFNVWDYGDVDSAPEGYISAANGFNGSGGCGFKVYTEEDTGNKALNLSAAWDNYGYRNIGLKGGGTYKLEFDYKTVVSKPWVFELVCHNNADTVTYNTGNAGVTGAGTKVLYKPGDWSFASPEWSHQSFTFTMDKDKPYLCLFVSVSGDFSTILFDNIKITEQQKAAPTVYLNGKEVDNNDYAVADVYTISEDAEITVTENEYPGLTFNGWYAPSDLENAISTEATYTYTQKFGQPNVVAKFTGAANLFTYAGVEGIDNSVYNNAANGWFVTANNGDAGIVGRSISTEEAHTGTQSYCMSYKYIHGMGRSITLEAGKSYRLNFWYKATAENLFLFQIGNRKSTTSRVVRSDDGMVFDDDHINAFTGEQFALVSKDWELFTADFTLDEDKDTIDLLFLQSGDVCNPFYIDDFSLIEVAGFSQLDYADNTDSYDMVRVYNISKPNISITYKYPATAQAAGQVIKFKLYNGEEPQNYTELIGTNPFDQIAEIENGVWTLKYYTMDGLDRTSAESTVVFRIQDDAATFCKDYTPGDVFADGEEWVNEQDVEALLKYIAGYEVEGLTKYSKALDVNGDRVIDEKDAFILDRYVAGWDVELKRGR